MERLKIDNFLDYKFLSSLKYSPNASKTAVIVKQANEKNGYDSVIYVNKAKGFEPLTRLNGNASNYFWADEEKIIFSETRDDEDSVKRNKGYDLTCFYEINVNGGEAVKAFTIDANIIDIKPLNNGEYLVYAAYDNNKPDLAGKTSYEQEEILKEFRKEQDYTVLDELPYWSDGKSGYTNKKRTRMYKYSPKTGLTPLTPPLARIRAYELLPCKKKLVFSGNIEYMDISEREGHIYTLDIESEEIKQLTQEKKGISTILFWEKANKLVVIASAENDETHWLNPWIYTVCLNSGEYEILSENDRSIFSDVGTDSAMGGGTTGKIEGDDFYFICLEGFYSDIFKMNLKTSEVENITGAKGSISFFDIKKDKIISVAMLNGRLQEVFSFENGEPIKETCFNDEIYNSTKHPVIEHHIIKDHEGIEFDGWVAYPVDYDKTKKYPAILNIHGGPRSVYGDVYFHEMQYWANENYFVLFSNPRGSAGKGNEFADIRGKYGMIDYDNIMQFCDEMVEKYPCIDKEKLGVTGGSYGGYMTNWIIGHNNKFAAAASQRSISNWFSYMIGDLGYFFTDYDILCNPWNDPQKLWWHSPLKYLDKAKTPTLLIHSDEDYRCCIPEGYQVFTALKQHGVDTRMCIFRGESHGLSRIGKPEHRVRRIKEITQWMDKYLKS